MGVVIKLANDDGAIFFLSNFREHNYMSGPMMGGGRDFERSYSRDRGDRDYSRKVFMMMSL